MSSSIECVVKNTVICLAVVIGGSLLLTPSGLSAQSDVEDMVIERRELMRSMYEAFIPLLAIKHNQSTDLEKAGEAAGVIRDAMVKSMELFPAGSAKGELEGIWSRAKPDIWTKYSEFEAAASELISTTTKLADVASSGSVDDFKIQVELVERACTECHEFKASGGGKFRFAK